MNTIEQIKPLPDFLLELFYSDGCVVMVDFKPIIKQGGVFAPLADAQFFNQARIGERGRYIEWPNEVDFCADSFRVGQAVELDRGEALAA